MVDPLMLKIKKADDDPIKDEIKKILLFSKKVSDMKSIIASHQSGKVLTFPLSKVINRTYGKKF